MSDEIEQLQKKIVFLEEQVERFSDDALRLMTERNEAMDEVSLLRSTVTDLNIEIEQLRKERDEARRLYCMAQSHVDEEYGKTILPEEQAIDKGWDCFKQENGK